jgi:hypothetical protein
MQLKFEAKKLASYINSLGLKIPKRKPSHQHVGAIITDAVLQVGRKYKTQVKPRVQRIRDKYPKADTISGLSYLVKTNGAQELLNWRGKDKQKIFLQTIQFFANEQVNTFNDLRKWLGSEDNRDRLITKSTRKDKAGIPKISNATADYYRVLVRLPDAVKVDSRVEEFLADAGIDIKQYEYKELRTIVQLAAKQLGKRPIDLDSAIWNHQGEKSNKRGGMAKKMDKAADSKREYIMNARTFSAKNGLTNESAIIDKMGRPANWGYRQFLEAVRGNFEKLWQSKSINGRPVSWKSQPRWFTSLDAYLRTSEGGKWLGKVPYWLSGPAPVTQSLKSGGIQISLSTADEAKLQELAGEFGVEPEVLAKLWILERVRQLSK